jgi:hypothetical protein
MPMDATRLREFATRYTAAWCGQSAASVASFFPGNGSLTIGADDLIAESRGQFDEAEYQRQLKSGSPPASRPTG